jgi:DNA-binding CsgD family transcriptional regulator
LHVAERFAAELRALADDRNDVVYRAMADFLSGTLASRQQQFSLAEVHYQRALILFREAGHEHGTAMMLHQLASVASDLGNLALAETQDTEALAIWGGRHDQWGSALALNGLALTAERQSRSDQAVRSYRAALGINARLGAMLSGATSLEGIARLASRTGQPRLAVCLFGVADAIRRTTGSDQDALERTRYDPALLEARAQLCQEDYEAAWREGQILTMEQAAALIETEFRTAPPSRASDVPGSPLSRRELEVLRLVATGRTDREIGDVLFISRRTVASHVTSILNKFGVSSRTAAAAIAVRNGLV